MAPDPKIGGNAPKWLVQAGIDGGWLDKSGKPTADKKEAPKPTGTGNGKQFNAAQDLKKLSYGLPNSFGGLELSSSPSLKVSKGDYKPMNTGIGTIGSDGANKLLARGKIGGDYKPHGAPLMRANLVPGRSGSEESRAAGPKPKVTGYHKPDATMTPGGVVHGDRTYKFGNS